MDKGETANTNANKAPITTIADIPRPSALYYNTHVFIYDLQNFKNEKDRVNSILTVDTTYIGAPYFSEEESEILKDLVIDGKKTLREVVEERLGDRLGQDTRIEKQKKEKDFQVCTAHDLAPIYEEMFGVKAKDLKGNEAFMNLIERGGPDAKDGKDWKGLGKR